jgi:hypothetical protein
MNINPASVASARTARLAREAATPVYTTTTGDAPRKAAPLPNDYIGEPTHSWCAHSIGYCEADWD